RPGRKNAEAGGGRQVQGSPNDRRLADPRLTVDNEHRRPRTGFVEKRGDSGEFGLAADNANSRELCSLLQGDTSSYRRLPESAPRHTLVQGRTRNVTKARRDSAGTFADTFARFRPDLRRRDSSFDDRSAHVKSPAARTPRRTAPLPHYRRRRRVERRGEPGLRRWRKRGSHLPK